MSCDFVTVDTVFFRRLYVLVFIELGTRIVHVAGITARPTGQWVTQQARNMIDVLTERASPMRFLIHDRDRFQYIGCGTRSPRTDRERAHRDQAAEGASQAGTPRTRRLRDQEEVS